MNRLRRLRWQLTALFTLTTAICLAVLAVLAGVIDQRSREDAVDAGIDRQATGLSRAVYFQNGTLHLEPLGEDYLAREAAGLAVLARTGDRWETRVELGRPRAVDPATFEQVLSTEDVVLTGGPDERMAVAPVWDESRIGAVVAVSAGPPDDGHAVLVRWLWIGCLALVLVAAGAGHLLSKLSMRPAVRSLGEQEQFLAEAAHELRTPLATLRLVVDGDVRDPAEVRRLVDRLGRLVTGLLTRARVRGGTQEIERTPLRFDQLVEQVADELGPGGVRVTTAPVVVHGDPELLAQAVRNLVDNALRHGGGDVEVSVSEGLLSVVDSGPGLGRSESAGNGIGLAIVRWVARLHGGSVRLADRAGGGVVAELRLPSS
ncbi:sensor histidine kinase [Lentzea sp. CA-135723]|uniref:sensor histidine kinase n=1 Tax=Lentzea sp. CA-135723 TaxID=3239950 RepID=UPI003D8F229F